MTTLNPNEHSYGGLWTRAGVRIPLEGVAVEGELLGAHIHVRVRQSYMNKEAGAVESVYTFPLPTDGTLTAFRMECNGRVMEGVVQEREKAFRTYDDAVVAGHGAALLEQERQNVFTANVGNLLPGELTVIEVEYVQRVALDEGSMRVMIPTLVAPRYIPSGPATAPTGHGTTPPNVRVPDADRITPPIGYTPYKVSLDLLVDLGREVQMDSVSHKIAVRREGHALYRVSFANEEVALDRDIVLEIRGAGTEQLATVAAHKGAEGEGYVALSILPDLLQVKSSRFRTDVTFLIDTSGSMEGDSIEQAKEALRVCLRHLREGDRFNILAFESDYNAFSKSSVVFNQQMLERADKWVSKLQASGGTELLAPMTFAAQNMSDGVIVLLTDGQVGNENEILQSVLNAMKGRQPSRVYSFGIGTNVSDQLLKNLARETHGAVEFIFPGERIEHKVVAQFARAIAPRVTGLSVKFSGVELAEIAPAELPPLVDAEPWTIFGRYETGGRGTATISGRAGGEEFVVEVPLNLPDRCEKPAIAKLWASERIRDFSSAKLDGRRADAMKARIIELSTTHGVASQYTSFVVVEKRSGDRRAQGGTPDTRVVPVNAPAGWVGIGRAELEADAEEDEFVASNRRANPSKKRAAPPKASAPTTGSVPGAPRTMWSPSPAAPPPQGAMRGGSRTRSQGAAPPPPSMAGPASGMPAPMPSMPSMPSMAAPMAPSGAGYGSSHGALGSSDEGASFDEIDDALRAEPIQAAPEAKPSLLERAKAFLSKPSAAKGDASSSKQKLHESTRRESDLLDKSSKEEASSELAPEPVAHSPQEIIGQQLASGLWNESSDESAVRVTSQKLWKLVQAGINTAHPMYGTPVKKAIDALLLRVKALGTKHSALTAWALAVAWLAATGRRTRGEIETLATVDPALKTALSDEAQARAYATANVVTG